MLAFLEEADKMIRGIVTDGVSLLISFSSTAIYQLFCKVGQAVGGARVRVEERGKDLVASSRGEFWRLLTPGLFPNTWFVSPDTWFVFPCHPCGPALGQAG